MLDPHPSLPGILDSFQAIRLASQALYLASLPSLLSLWLPLQLAWGVVWTGIGNFSSLNRTLSPIRPAAPPKKKQVTQRHQMVNSSLALILMGRSRSAAIRDKVL